MQYPVFKPEMKDSYTILVPDMLPVHFKLIINILKKYGYNVELLQTSTREVVDEGLKNVHNDTCYPALLVIGQFINALKSGKYDVNKTALMLTQTGGGCRASNYIHLLRKALKKEFPQVPVISLNLSGLEKGNGLDLTLPLLIKVVYAVFYGDLLMSLYNQCKPYEINKGDTDKMRDLWQQKLIPIFDKREFLKCKKYCRMMCEDFDTIKRTKEKKIRVGIVGEIYVKYSPLANNHLEEFHTTEELCGWLNELCRLLCRKLDSSLNDYHQKLCESVTSYIDENYASNTLCLNDIASEANVSPAYLSALFKKKQGVSISDYITTQRINAACRYLTATNMTLKEISMKCGYANQYYFSTSFKKKMNVTPSAYRDTQTSKS
mgnify:CR=1 FL=1